MAENLNLDGVIFAWGIVGDGTCKPLVGQEISDEIRHDNLAWVHMDAKHPDTRKWIEKEVSYLDDIVLDALLAEETHPRIVEVGIGVMMILRGFNYKDDATADDMISLRVYADPHRIISLRNVELNTVRDIEKKLKQGNGPRDVGDFISMLSMRLFERMGPLISKFEHSIDDIEERVLEGASHRERNEIIEVRKKAIMMRRYITPQREVMAMLEKSEMPWMSELNRRQIKEAHDMVSRYVEVLDSVRDRSQVVKDEITNVLSDRLNKNMYIVSLITAVFLPLTFLTGLLGINVEGIPGSRDTHAFWDVTFVLGFLLIVQLFIFKKLKWF